MVVQYTFNYYEMHCEINITQYKLLLNRGGH